jgi:hypothetical protein
MNAMNGIHLGILVFVTSVPVFGRRPTIVQPAQPGGSVPQDLALGAHGL